MSAATIPAQPQTTLFLKPAFTLVAQGTTLSVSVTLQVPAQPAKLRN